MGVSKNDGNVDSLTQGGGWLVFISSEENISMDVFLAAMTWRVNAPDSMNKRCGRTSHPLDVFLT